MPSLASSPNLGVTFGSPFKHEITSAPQLSNMMLTMFGLEVENTLSKESLFDWCISVKSPFATVDSKKV